MKVLLLASALALLFDCRQPPPPGTGCMGECPTPPDGCVRTTIDPGSCSDTACSTPPPVCHYGRAPDAGDGVVCPPALTGRCVAP